MTKINDHFPTPTGVNPYRHPSQTVQSSSNAGGQVPRDQYRQPVPAPAPAPSLPPRQKD
jgi:hypothetical protein